MPETTVHTTDLIRFLEALYGTADRDLVCIYSLPDKRAQFFPVDQLHKAAQHALQQAAQSNVYVSVGLHAQKPRQGRGTATNILALPAFQADIDIAHHLARPDRVPCCQCYVSPSP